MINTEVSALDNFHELSCAAKAENSPGGSVSYKVTGWPSPGGWCGRCGERGGLRTWKGRGAGKEAEKSQVHGPIGLGGGSGAGERGPSGRRGQREGRRAEPRVRSSEASPGFGAGKGRLQGVLQPTLQEEGREGGVSLAAGGGRS